MNKLKKILNLTYDPIIIMFICNVFLTFIIKRLINGIHKMFLKHSMTNGFRTHNFLTFTKRFLSNVCKTQKCLLGSNQLYYCNFLLYGNIRASVSKLQKGQNALLHCFQTRQNDSCHTRGFPFYIVTFSNMTSLS